VSVECPACGPRREYPADGPRFGYPDVSYADGRAVVSLPATNTPSLAREVVIVVWDEAVGKPVSIARATGSAEIYVSVAIPALPPDLHALSVVTFCDLDIEAYQERFLGGGGDHRRRQMSCHAFSRPARRICSISSKCDWSQISGGESWMTGSARSSARQ